MLPAILLQLEQTLRETGTPDLSRTSMTSTISSLPSLKINYLATLLLQTILDFTCSHAHIHLFLIHLKKAKSTLLRKLSREVRVTLKSLPKGFFALIHQIAKPSNLQVK